MFIQMSHLDVQFIMVIVLGLSLNKSESERNISGILIFFVSVARCCGLCVPNMIITKANAKEN